MILVRLAGVLHTKPPEKRRAIKSKLSSLRVIAASLALATCALTNSDAAEPSTELLVLDIELTGDLGGPAFEAQHEMRLKMASTRLREAFERTGAYQMVDVSRAKSSIDRLSAQHRFLHSCGECVLQIGREAGADRVVATWVYRVSNLILTLNYEMSDVSSGQITSRKSFDFRGDNDRAWMHAIDYGSGHDGEPVSPVVSRAGQQARARARDPVLDRVRAELVPTTVT